MLQLETIFDTKLFWVATVLVGVYTYLRYVVYNYWRRNNIPHDTPLIPFGNIPFSYFQGKATIGSVVIDSCKKHGKHRLHGLYILYEPVLVINDLDLVQLVLVKHFSSFVNRGSLSDEVIDPLSVSVARVRDDKWKKLRSKLSPTFTSGKLKLMYPLVKEICEKLVDVCADKLKKSDVVEVKSILTRYTIDCISSVAFGFNCDSLNDEESVFCKNVTLGNRLGQFFVLVSFFMPQLAKVLPIPKSRRQVERFFVDLFQNMVKQRKEDQTVRNDFLDMLIQLMEVGKVQDDKDSAVNKTFVTKLTEADKLTMIEAVGQAFIFLTAGQEATASSIISCLFELASYPEVQEKLYQELHEVSRSPDGLTYEKFNEMQYLDMVFSETLRKHSSVYGVNRICLEDFKVPDSDFIIKKGMRVIIPVASFHRNPEYFPDPEVFDPTRFTAENKAKRHSSCYLPFGDGPRQCIGTRLGKMKSKLAIYHLVLNYKFFKSEKTARITYVPDTFLQVPDDVHLKLEKRNK